MNRIQLFLSSVLMAVGCNQVTLSPQPPAIPADRDTEFESTMDLLRAIENGTFAERADLTEEIEAATLPNPVQVAFVSGTQVPPEQREVIEDLAATVGSREDLSVDLVGCSDPSGPESLNLRISQARAAAVAAMLRDLGVDDAQIGEVVGRGESCETQERVVHLIPTREEGDA